LRGVAQNELRKRCEQAALLLFGVGGRREYSGSWRRQQIQF